MAILKNQQLLRDNFHGLKITNFVRGIMNSRKGTSVSIHEYFCVHVVLHTKSNKCNMAYWKLFNKSK